MKYSEDQFRMMVDKIPALAWSCRSDGATEFLVRYKPLRDEKGQILRWYATGTDIEDHKRAEERMENENLALRREIESHFDVRGNCWIIREVARGPVASGHGGADGLRGSDSE
jgi:hypothetical protein